MTIKLLSKVNDRYLQALEVHRCSADLYAFLAFEGFKQLHNYQYAEEAQVQRKLKEFITKTYNVLLPDNPFDYFEVIDPKIKNKKRTELTSAEICEAIKYNWKCYCDWEYQTLNIYETIAKQLSEESDIIGYDYVKNLAVMVNEELQYVNSTIVTYNAMDWDAAQLVAEQDTLHERYLYLMRELHKEFEQGHHFNSLVDQYSRSI